MELRKLPLRLLSVLAATTLAAQTVDFTVLKEGVLEERLRLAHPKNAERFRRLKQLFEQSGCSGEALREQKVRGSKEPNLICSAPAAETGAGAGVRKIILGAHFDCQGGDGVVDNWSGAVLLPTLSEFLRRKPRRHEFEFVGFAAEEKGLVGSTAYLKSLSKEERARIAAVITVDSVGLTPTKFWPNSSDRDLVLAAAAVARALKLDFAGVNVDRVGTTDSKVFQTAGIPTLSLHSVTQETWKLINAKSDVWSAVSWKDYYDTHRLLSALLVYLDGKLP
jgi:hypothetical protein